MNKSTKIIVIIGIILIIIVGILFLSNKLKNKNSTTSQINISNSSEKKIVKGNKVPEFTFTNLNGKQIKLSDFKGKKVMVWMVATWCSSCIAGAKTLAKNHDKLKNLIIITLKTYNDAGYPGPSIEEFKQRILLGSSIQNWIWGNASKETTSIYNPRNFPDIYFLINKNGILQSIDGAPTATIGEIIKFANK